MTEYFTVHDSCQIKRYHVWCRLRHVSVTHISNSDYWAKFPLALKWIMSSQQTPFPAHYSCFRLLALCLASGTQFDNCSRTEGLVEGSWIRTGSSVFSLHCMPLSACTLLIPFWTHMKVSFGKAQKKTCCRQGLLDRPWNVSAVSRYAHLLGISAVDCSRDEMQKAHPCKTWALDPNVAEQKAASLHHCLYLFKKKTF